MKKMGRGNSFRTTPRSKSGKLMRPAVFMHQMVTTAGDSGVVIPHMTTTATKVSACANAPKRAPGVGAETHATPIGGQLGWLWGSDATQPHTPGTSDALGSHVHVSYNHKRKIMRVLIGS